MIDVKVFETGNGGDLFLNGNDIAKAFSFDNMPYLAMFGGNVGFSTPTKREPSAQAFDYWANSLIFGDSPEAQFNSFTEAALERVDLNSNGRLTIQEAVKKDLKFMDPFSKTTVDVTILAQDKVSIGISILQPENKVIKKFMYIWDGALLIDETLTYSPKPNDILGLDELLEYEI